MPYAANFLDARKRHWRDAELLFHADRWANADQLYGFSAECGLKAVMESLGMATDDTGKPEAGEHRQHVQDLWPAFLVFAEARGGERLASLLPGDKPFADWSQPALHFESIKRGVQKASRIRVAEIREDYPWMHRVLGPLTGMTVPCRFEEIVECWDRERTLERLIDGAEQDEIKLPPRHVDHGVTGIREDLESLGVFQHLYDGRVNIPDVFRVGYGLGRKGGVEPVQ